MIKKVINGSTIHLERNKVQLGIVLGRYNTGSNKIHLNLKAIDKIGHKINDISVKTSLILTHEYMHKLLYLTENEDTCDAWDNISSSFLDYGSS